jgi:membrane protein DedA with SNARE-associated domain
VVLAIVKHRQLHHYLEVPTRGGHFTMRITEPTPKQQQVLKVVSGLVALGTIILAISFKDQISEFGEWGYAGIFIVSLIGNATIFMPLPILLTIGAMGAVLNPLLVGVIASLGAVIGESFGYFLGLAGSVVIQKSAKYEKVKVYIKKYGVWGVFVLASFPNPLFDLAGILAGATGITYKQFFVASWAGIFIKYTLISVIGYRLFV